MPKFLCVKGILFFSFWQAIAISTLVSTGVITRLGPYTDAEHISLGLTDTLICLEMPLFAFAHMYAFSYRDFIDPRTMYVARMPIYNAVRDAFGLLDVLEDSKATLRGEGMDYREFEPSEGMMHQGLGRERRIRAGLRYTKGGRKKYWLPRPDADTVPPGRVERGVNRVITKVAGRDQGEEVYAPLLGAEADDVVHLAPDLQEDGGDTTIWGEPHAEGGYELPFGDMDEGDEELFDHVKNYVFGDYNYPVLDVSSERARDEMWDEEERILRDERGAWASPIRAGARLDHGDGPFWKGYGAVGSSSRAPPSQDERHQRVVDHGTEQRPSKPGDLKLNWTKHDRASPTPGSPADKRLRKISASPAQSPAMSRTNSSSKIKSGSPVLPPDAVDLVVEDDAAAQEELIRERRKGEPAMNNSAGLKRVYRRGFVAHDSEGHRAEGEVEIEDEDDADRGRERVEAGEAVLDAIGDEGEDAERKLGRDGSGRELEIEGLVGTVETPPLHARVYVDKVGHDSEENPWA